MLNRQWGSKAMTSGERYSGVQIGRYEELHTIKYRVIPAVIFVVLVSASPMFIVESVLSQFKGSDTATRSRSFLAQGPDFAQAPGQTESDGKRLSGIDAQNIAGTMRGDQIDIATGNRIRSAARLHDRRQAATVSGAVPQPQLDGGRLVWISMAQQSRLLREVPIAAAGYV